MSYQTGAAASRTDLLEALRSFASGLGWNINAYSSGSYLQMNKGKCFVSLIPDTYSYSLSTGVSGSGTTTFPTGKMLRGGLSTAFAAGVTSMYGHPNGLTSGSSNTQSVVVTNLDNINAYHLFGGTTPSDYIHMIVQVNGDQYVHLSMGHLDPKGMSHGGVGYLSGHNSSWYQNGFLGATGHTSWRPSSQVAPFASAGSTQQLMYAASGALPATTDFAGAGGIGSSVGTHGLTAVSTIRPADQPADVFGVTYRGARLLDAVALSEASSWSGVAMMWGIPLLMMSSSSSQLVYAGDFPDVRLINMSAYVPAQEISLTSDTWKIFPVLRQAGWGAPETSQPSSGQYAIAYKKT